MISEIALALVLLKGAGLVLKRFLRLRAVDPGFRPENVVTMAVDLLRMVLRRTLALMCAVIAIGTAGALAVTRVLTKFLFEVRPTDLLTFIVVALVLVCAALAAGWIPARRATLVAMVALRYSDPVRAGICRCSRITLTATSRLTRSVSSVAQDRCDRLLCIR